ncbi:hypothetical protein [Vibrio sp. D431a]|uniref:hypothetical protein n=1 Tax=Vibrio sp. D431a TaxID=2837388 RepID=UPI002552D9F3|nr:hypothetical protein [Vibrio sp. D431a]MDK9790688.1 hypothetical protein [Vibrio sp. D431a]
MSFSVNATQDGQSHVSLTASSIEDLKLEDIIDTPQKAATKPTLKVEDTQTDKEKSQNREEKPLPEDTLLEKLIREKNFTEALTLIDKDVALKSFVSEVAEARGMALGVKDEIAQRMSTFDRKQVLLARIFDNLQIELQVTINALRAPDYDISKAILRELKFSSDESCQVNKDWYNGFLSLVYECGNKSNGYLIDVDTENYSVKHISSDQFGRLKDGMADIAHHF